MSVSTCVNGAHVYAVGVSCVPLSDNINIAPSLRVLFPLMSDNRETSGTTTRVTFRKRIQCNYVLLFPAAYLWRKIQTETRKKELVRYNLDNALELVND